MLFLTLTLMFFAMLARRGFKRHIDASGFSLKGSVKDKRERRPSMVLNGNDIESRRIIERDSNTGYRAASYDLTVGRIISSDGEEIPSLWLKPQSIVRVISHERLKVPKNVVGFATVKTSLCDEGILPLNIGIVDPGYEGPISTTLLNFGTREYLIRPGRTFLRVSFHEYHQPEHIEPIKIADEDYLADKKIRAQNFSDTFLNISTLEQKVAQRIESVEQIVTTAKSEVRGWIGRGIIMATLLLTILPFLVTLGVDYTSRTGWTREQFRSEVINQVRQDKERELETQIKDLQNELRELKDSIKARAPENSQKTGER
ncbi:MAG: dCTP deaminase domain-containing protein [Blastocatellia bacterium]